jgi:hypothetical protein
MTNDELNPNDKLTSVIPSEGEESRDGTLVATPRDPLTSLRMTDALSPFGLRNSFVIRHSDFII